MQEASWSLPGDGESIYYDTEMQQLFIGVQTAASANGN